MSKTVSKDICISAASEANAPEFTITFAEAATQTFKAGGTTVFVNGSGYIQDTASDTPTTIMGVPNQDGNNNAAAGTGNGINVSLANATNIFAANVLTTSLADYVLTQADIGRQMGIQRDTVNNRLFLNAGVSGGANIRVFTLALAQNTDVGDTNGRLLFVFLPNWSQSLGTS